MQGERVGYSTIFGFPRNVLFLSVISFFNDIGGETIKKTIPLYLANVLGVKPVIVGLIEGVADATPQLLQPISGYISDRFHRRKALIAVGQTLRSSMVLLFFVTTWPGVLVVRFLDRSGKGIATAPRDALISDSATTGHVGKAFGLSRMFDNAGAVVGLLLAGAVLVVVGQGATTKLTPQSFQAIVLLSIIPLLLSFGIAVFLIRDVSGKVKKLPLSFQNGLGKKFYLFLFLSFLFTLGNSSDAFLILKAQLVGFPMWGIFLLLAGYSLVSAASGLPLSGVSDTIGRKKLLVAGWLLYAATYFFIGINQSLTLMIVFVVLYGLYYGLTEGSAKAFVSDIVPNDRRGVAFGMYHMVTGLTLFVASFVAGFLWQTIAPSAPFFFGSVMALVAGLGLLIFF